MWTKMVMLLVPILFIFSCIGCGGHEPNPVALHQVGDDMRSCESLRLEIAQNETFITKKLSKDSSKLWTNTAWFLFFIPAMDLKEAEKTEAEALQHRNECLKILMVEKGCGATVATDPPPTTDPNKTTQQYKKFMGYKVVNGEYVRVYE